MKKSALFTLLLFAVATALRAQSLQLDAALECDSYVQFESVTLTLSLRNFGITPFIVDDYGEYRNNSVTIVLRHETAGYREQAREGMPFGALMVSPQQTTTVACNINEWFSLLQEGKYTVQVFARRGGETFASRIIAFSIVRGLVLSTETHMLPGSDTRARVYTLLYWPRKQREDLFLRVTEVPSDNVVALFRLGPVVRYVTPRLEFPEEGRMCVLQQIGRDRFVRTTFRSDASGIEVLERQQLVDANQALMQRSLLESRARDREAGEAVLPVRRRKRPEDDPDASDARKASGKDDK